MINIIPQNKNNHHFNNPNKSKEESTRTILNETTMVEGEILRAVKDERHGYRKRKNVTNSEKKTF